MKTNTLLDSLQSSHTSLDGLKMLVITWNVNAKLDEAKNLKSLFFDPREEVFGDAPEIIVVGLQEMVELSTSNVIGGSRVGASSERADMWRSMVLQVLKERETSYEMVASKNMVGLCITIFALRAFRLHISKVQVSCLGRGVGGVLGNKGAVYARFNVRDTTVCLVCAHFAAHRENLLKRNEDFHAILAYKAFPSHLEGVDTHGLNNISQHSASAMTAEAAKCARLQERIDHMKRTLIANRVRVGAPSLAKGELRTNFSGPLDHDIIIWFGDLNYRLLGGMENSRIYDYIDGNRAHVLLAMDQLNIERENGNVFQGFHEGLITFDPTYKYLPGTPGYIRERTPAWCDRVLWRLKHAHTRAVYEEVHSTAGVPGLAEASIYSGSTGAWSPPPPPPPSNNTTVRGAGVEDAPQPGNPSHSSSCSADEACAQGGGYPVIAEVVPGRPTVLHFPPGANGSTGGVSSGQLAFSASSADSCAGDYGAVPSVPVDASLASVSESYDDALGEVSLATDIPDVCASGPTVHPPAVATTVVDDGRVLAAPALSHAMQLGDLNSPTSIDMSLAAHTLASTTSGPEPSQLSPQVPPSLHSPPNSKAAEIVELMMYNRGENIISDHKPVRALMGIKYRKVDWAAHEQELISRYRLRAEGRPYHSPTFQATYGVAPVVYWPRAVTLLTSCHPPEIQQIVIHNNSYTNFVRFSLVGTVFPSWVSVAPMEGFIAPDGETVLEVSCHFEEAEQRYAQAAVEDAQFADSPLRPVWRRHISNPDHRGNPQLSVMLQVELFTHLNATTAPGTGPGTNTGPGTGPGTDTNPGDGSLSLAPPVATAIPLPSDDPDALMRECVFAMTPLLIPILCKVTVTVPGT